MFDILLKKRDFPRRH